MKSRLKGKYEYVIQLTDQDFEGAMTLASEKYKFSRKIGHKDRMKGSVESLILTDARAIVAEQAVGRLMGWTWERKINGAGQPDFFVDGYKVDVKSTIRPYPTLRIPTYGETGISKNKMDRFVLVSVCRSHDHAVILGWIGKHKAMRNGKHGSRPSGCFWEVKRQFLLPMEDW
jgi:hypothetical protein